ncbi:MAG: non-hydrolyzing UDP-N-acetylglucosamine 2-epimerase [Vampirovibrionales bacterium]
MSDLSSHRPCRILSVFGTRPEAIKMAPLVNALARHPSFDAKVCVTAQHREMLDQVLDLFGIRPDIDLNLMRANQTLTDITVGVLTGMQRVLLEWQPDMVLVHGDTTTTLATSLACYYNKIPVGHVEAGLRTYDCWNPYPEELNRIVSDSVSTLHFAPTPTAQENLIRLGVQPERITVTGNTVIDALFYTLAHTKAPRHQRTLVGDAPYWLVTLHRRENFGERLTTICHALLELLMKYPDRHLVLPVHPNPQVKTTVEAILGHPSLPIAARIHLLAPQDYAPFCHWMKHAELILTDSGGVQEEAPSLGKPVLVFRDETERPEAVTMGTVKLVGADQHCIHEVVSTLLDTPERYQAMAQAVNPYGTGHAVPMILETMLTWWQAQPIAT